MPATTRRASAPGRVTVLGEHTDYNAGCSLGVATPERTTVTAHLDDSGVLVVRSAPLGTARCSLSDPAGPAHLLLAASLARRAGIRGASIEVTSEVPLGAGLSSSAAYAVAAALALGIEGDDLTVAVACREAERDAGSDVGLLDPLVILAARAGHVVDCDFAVPRAVTFPLAPGVGLSLVDTGERRTLADSAYAERRAQCAAAAELVGPLGLAGPDAIGAIPDGPLRRRARHVISECARVRAGRAALHAGDLATLGRLLDEGHASLREDFEVSTPGVERVRDEVRRLDGVLGARLTGAGFGGWLLIVHAPSVNVEVPGRAARRLVPSRGAGLSPTS